MAATTKLCSVLVLPRASSCQPRHAMQLCDSGDNILPKTAHVKAQVAQGRGNRGVRGQMTPRNLPGGQAWYFDPQIFFRKYEYFLVHTHMLLLRLHYKYIIF